MNLPSLIINKLKCSNKSTSSNRGLLKCGLYIITAISLINIGISIFIKNDIVSIIISSAISVISLYIIFIKFYWKRILSKIIKRNFPAGCQFYVKEECPYEIKSECPYVKNDCLKDKKPVNYKKRRSTLFYVITVAISLFVVFANTLLDLNPELDYNINNLFSNNGIFSLRNILSGLSTISITFIAGSILSFVLDIPGRLKEYKENFIEMLSSTSYLKSMDENRLLKLRQEVTTQLHTKDVPRMPKGLIKLDEEICNMLRKPYFRRYSQNITIMDNVIDKSDIDKSEKFKYRKLNSIEYTVCNPFANIHPVIFDLGIKNEIITEISEFDGISIKETKIKEAFKLKKFTLKIDSMPNEINLLNHINIYFDILKKDKDSSSNGYQYDTHIMISGKELGKNLEKPLSIYDFEKESIDSLKYLMTEKGTDGEYKENKFYVKFEDKITVKLDYEVLIHKKDLVFTKRLRYPVKHLSLTCHSSAKKLSLRGDLIGTLINGSDISLRSGNDYITIETNNWLLPKNGAIIVMIPNDSDNDLCKDNDLLNI